MICQSALMKWRDNGFSKESLNEGEAGVVESIFNRLQEEKFGPVEEGDVLEQKVVNKVQRVEMSIRDQDAVFYKDGTLYDKKLNEVELNGKFSDRWVDIVAEASLIDLDGEKFQNVVKDKA